MLSPKTKRNISRILPFGLIWLVCGWTFIFIEYIATDGFKYLAKEVIDMDFGILIFANAAVFLIGLGVGALEVIYLNNVFTNKSFGKKIGYKLLLYVVIFLIIIFITYPLAACLELNTNILDKRVWDRYFSYFISYTNLSTNVQLSISLGLSLFYKEISDNIGHQVLINFFTGKYHLPTEEERIFMFTDMRSSTTIAEKLGHIKYFELLKTYYNDLSDAIIKHNGELYQYVGDEVIISWEFEKGIAQNNCLECFFSMKQDLKKKVDRYQQKFGVVPDFKAGLHFGKVTTGEIGALKKEIIFTGDVLNATARIQGLCNQYNTDLLVSEELVSALKLTQNFNTQHLGEAELRGRKGNITLYTIAKITDHLFKI